MAQDNGQGKEERADVSQGLGLQEPDDVELFFWEPTAPQYETHEHDGQHTVEDTQDTVMLEQK